MQQPTPLTMPSADRPEPVARPRLPADVPSDQLWRAAIQATRDAASAAAELRRALGGPARRPAA